MKKNFLINLLVLSVFYLSNCNNNEEEATPDPLQIVSPNPTSFNKWTDFGYDNGFISVTVQFDKPIDKNSVVVGETVILSTSSTASVDGVITWVNDNTLTFTSTSQVGNWCSFTPDCFFTFTLVGSDAGNGEIESIDGGTLGANVEYEFGVLG